MTDRIAVEGLPLALLADDGEERTGWLARLLEEAGYAVLRERTARDALERGRAAQPDLIIIGGDLPDMPAIELCRVLRGDARITRGTPIFLAPAEPLTRDGRLAALREGAWECIAPPHDSDEIVLKANSYVRGKVESDRTRADGLLDPQTGLYNHQGLARRARELASQAFREHGALACVALALDIESSGLRREQAADTIARGVSLLQATARRSDVVGRLGPAEFAVLAPGTDAAGARRLAERLAGSMQVAMAPDRTAGTPPPHPRFLSPSLGIGVRFGYEAIANVGYAPIEPAELLVRASAAVRTGKAEVGGWIRRFDAGVASVR